MNLITTTAVMGDLPILPADDREVFNPRYLRPSSIGIAEGEDRFALYEQLDELVDKIRYFNFGNSHVHISTATGEVRTLAGSNFEEIQGTHTYQFDNLWDAHGQPMMNRRDMRFTKVPKIQPGLYIAVEKSVEKAVYTPNGDERTRYYTHPDNVDLGDGLGEGTVEYSFLSGRHDGTPASKMVNKDVEKSNVTTYNGRKISRYYDTKADPSSRTPTSMLHKRAREVVTTYQEYYIPSEVLDKHSGSQIYIRELDIVIGIGVRPIDTIHPYSERGLGLKLNLLVDDDLPENSKESIGGVVVVNVNNTTQGSADVVYTNLGNVVVCAEAIASKARKDGIYIYIYGGRDEEDKRTSIRMIYTTHDEAFNGTVEHVPRFYRTYAEAKSSGDVVRELEKQLVYEKKELAILKSKLEQEKAKRDDYYDSRSSDRKDSSEALKWGFGIIGLAAGVIIKALI